MKYTVFGAGSVGTVLAGLLAGAGVDVSLSGRGAIESLRLEGDEETIEVSVPVVEEPVGTILLCVHEPDVADVCRRWSGRTVVTFCNGVTGEDQAAPWCRVIGAVWRMTCFLSRPGDVLFTRRGRVILGRHPDGIDDEVRRIAGDLARAGLHVGLAPRIRCDKWLKLCLNVASTVNAVVRREDHARPEFGAVKAALLEEARDLLARRGIEAVSSAGEDLSLDEEIEKHRTQLSTRTRPVFNNTWRMLSLGRRPKEPYHDVICGLGAAPRNEAMRKLLESAPRPECYRIEDVFSAVCGSSGDS